MFSFLACACYGYYATLHQVTIPILGCTFLCYIHCSASLSTSSLSSSSPSSPSPLLSNCTRTEPEWWRRSNLSLPEVVVLCLFLCLCVNVQMSKSNLWFVLFVICSCVESLARWSPLGSHHPNRPSKPKHHFQPCENWVMLVWLGYFTVFHSWTYHQVWNSLEWLKRIYWCKHWWRYTITL